VQRPVADINRWRQDERQRLRQIADRLVAFVEQPVRHAGRTRTGFAQHARRDRLPRLAAREEVHRPRSVCRRHLREVSLHRLHAMAGGCAAVEREVEGGEALHRVIVAERSRFDDKPARRFA
jgi:hypothetical protein